MQLFFSDDIESDICTLSDDESRHCIKVLRMAAGDELFLTDGRGTLCRCRILDAHPKACTVEVVERTRDYGRHSFFLHIAIAPTKNTARTEWFVEKAVEMGIDRISPIVCDHSERCVLKKERLDKIAVSAVKQSLKAYLPEIDPPTPVTELIDSPFDGQRFIAYCDGDHRTPLHSAYKPGSNALILIGPEGDFSPSEVQRALSAGFIPVTLGSSRLRTETAALAATAFFNLSN
ncbi:MAG: 16S rRNA (uracil(1498)-N(3))-methyltransferase [Bacteroidales bacterium]|nr:16S rRNA (uracil(1498)-N(3))-methyltransferase [Bacteroidales bacterium]